MDTSQVRISYVKAWNIDKEVRKYQNKYEYWHTIDFFKLPNLLQKSYNYNPFFYKGGIRKKDMLYGTADFIVIDVDYTHKTIQQRHEELLEEDLTHIITTTSDSENMKKYRILIPLSIPVTAEEYTRVVRGVQEYDLVSDMDRASKVAVQQFYSYANNPVILTHKGDSLDVNSYMTDVIDYDVSETVEHKSCSHFLNRYHSVPMGQGNYSLYRAREDMIKMGYTYAQLKQCIERINQAWVKPMDTDRLMNTIIYPAKQRCSN